MLVIRLFRIGKKNQPSFKIVVTDKTKSSRAGRFVEEVGFYNPLTKEKILKQERIKYWLSVGAQPSPTIHNLLVSEKIIEGKKSPIYIKKKKEEAPAAQAPAEKKPEETKEEKAKGETTQEAKPVAEKPVEEKPSEEKPKEEAAEKPAQEEKKE
jgi:small subunit ribosomal protein S16